jgi:hypothetical protein
MKPTRRRAKAPSRSRRGAKKSPRPKRSAKKPRRARKAAPLGRQAVEALERKVRRLRLVRGKLERRLTEAVQEIGTLRQFELRVQILERQLRARDEEISRLRHESDERSGGASIVSAPS